MFYRKRYCGSGDVIVREDDVDAMCGDGLSRDLRESRRSETRVIPNDEALFRLLMFQHVRGDRGRDQTHVLIGEIVGNDAAPSVSAELDVCDHISL